MVIGKCRDVFRGIFCLGGGGGGSEEWGKFSMEKFVLGEEDFHKGGTAFSSIILKKQRENKYERVFFQLEVWSSIKRTENITHIRGSPPPNTLLFTLKDF